MGCGGSKQQRPAATSVVGSRLSTSGHNRIAEAVTQDAWRHPDPMKSPYPQGKPDEVLSRIRDPSWAVEENIRVMTEVVPVQMEGKIVKESWAVQQGVRYQQVNETNVRR